MDDVIEYIVFNFDEFLSRFFDFIFGVENLEDD